MLVLRIIKNDRVVHERVIEQLPIVIGRDAKSDVLILNDTVSKSHARISADENGVMTLTDLDSLNGVYHSGQRVKEVVLKDETKLFIGQVEVAISTFKDLQTQEIKTVDLEQMSQTSNRGAFGLIGMIVGLMGLWTIVQKAVFNQNEFEWLDFITSWALNSGAFLLVSVVVFLSLKPVNRKLTYQSICLPSMHVLVLAMIIGALEYCLYYFVGEFTQNVFEWLFGALFIAFVAMVLVFKPLGLLESRRRVYLFGGGSFVVAFLIIVIVLLNVRKDESGVKDVRVQAPVLGWSGPSNKKDDLFELLQEMHSKSVKLAERKRNKLNKNSSD